MATEKFAVILANLGSPPELKLKAIKAFLRNFLMDELVVDIPKPLRFFLVNCIVLPLRAPRLLRAYRRIWSPEGNPFLLTTRSLATGLQKELKLPVRTAMRYTPPSFEQVLSEFKFLSIRKVLLIPLFPHYALATYETTVRACREARDKLAPDVALRILRPFYKEEAYIAALASRLKPFIEDPFDHVLFSYHSLPLRHLRKADPTGRHCLRVPDCCHTPSEAHEKCYKFQITTTSELVAKKAEIPKEKYSICFQSKFGPGAWLGPSLGELCRRLPRQGKTRVVVMSPSFVIDCLETLEEIAQLCKNTFLEAGGSNFTYVPCLNDCPEWRKVLSLWIREQGERFFAL